MKKRWPLLLGSTAVSVYLTWTVLDRAPGEPPEPPSVVEATAVRREPAAIVAVQPRLVEADFLDVVRFARALDEAIVAAKREGVVAEGAVVVLPAHVGTGLVLVGEKRGVVSRRRIGDAFRLLAASNLPAYLPRRASGRAPTVAVLRMKAAAMARAYQRALSEVARAHGATVVGGSIVLPDPSIVDGRIALGRGPLVEAGFVFRPDGSLAPVVVRRASPDPDPRLPLAARRAPSPVVVDTPAGRVGVLLSGDASDPFAYDAFVGGVDFLAVPSSAREGAEGADVQVVAARSASTGARAAAVPALRARFFDVETRGRSAVVDGVALHLAADVDGAVVLGR